MHIKYWWLDKLLLILKKRNTKLCNFPKLYIFEDFRAQPDDIGMIRYIALIKKIHHVVLIMAQIIWSTRSLVKVLLGIQQKFYQTSSRAIFLLLDVQQIFTPSKRRLVGSYFSATRRLVENFYQTSSTKSSTRRLVEQKIWAIVQSQEINPVTCEK